LSYGAALALGLGGYITISVETFTEKYALRRPKKKWNDDNIYVYCGVGL
jgi:hypothetical protein